jgi:hypothetical protein
VAAEGRRRARPAAEHSGLIGKCGQRVWDAAVHVRGAGAAADQSSDFIRERTTSRSLPNQRGGGGIPTSASNCTPVVDCQVRPFGRPLDRGNRGRQALLGLTLPLSGPEAFTFRARFNSRPGPSSGILVLAWYRRERSVRKRP